MVTSHTQAPVKGLFNQLNFAGYFFETLKSNQHSYANQQQQRQQNGKLLPQSFTVISWSPSSTTTDVSSFPHGDVEYVLANSPPPSTTWQNPDHPLWHSFDKLSCKWSICHINYTQTYSSNAATLILLPLSARTSDVCRCSKCLLLLLCTQFCRLFPFLGITGRHSGNIRWG